MYCAECMHVDHPVMISKGVTTLFCTLLIIIPHIESILLVDKIEELNR